MVFGGWCQEWYLALYHPALFDALVCDEADRRIPNLHRPLTLVLEYLIRHHTGTWREERESLHEGKGEKRVGGQ